MYLLFYKLSYGYKILEVLIVSSNLELCEGLNTRMTQSVTTRHSVRAETRDRTEASYARDQGNVPASLVTSKCLRLMQITHYKEWSVGASFPFLLHFWLSFVLDLLVARVGIHIDILWSHTPLSLFRLHLRFLSESPASLQSLQDLIMLLSSSKQLKNRGLDNSIK